jgi:hypothetical protein
VAHLFERLVIDEASSILGNFELALLDVLAELPWLRVSREVFTLLWGYRELTLLKGLRAC